MALTSMNGTQQMEGIMANDKCRITNGNEWMHCGVCNGRIHLPDCTGRKRKGIDCLSNHTPQEMEEAGYGPASQFKEGPVNG